MAAGEAGHPPQDSGTVLQHQQTDLPGRLLFFPDGCHPVLQSLEHSAHLTVEEAPLVVEGYSVAQPVEKLHPQLPFQTGNGL